MSATPGADWPWPKAGAALFVRGARDWEHNAWLPPEPEWVGYVEGYERAVQVLVAHVIEKDRDQDFLVYPLLFVARHAVELRLKEVVVVTRRLLAREGEPFPAGHELEHLWRLARSLLERLDEQPATEDLDAVDEYIEQLAGNDRQSFTFRYPVERDGKTPSHPLVLGDYVPALGARSQESKLINLCHFGAAIGIFLPSCQPVLNK